MVKPGWIFFFLWMSSVLITSSESKHTHTWLLCFIKKENPAHKQTACKQTQENKNGTHAGGAVIQRPLWRQTQLKFGDHTRAPWRKQVRGKGVKERLVPRTKGEKNEWGLNWLGGVMEDGGERGVRGDGDGWANGGRVMGEEREGRRWCDLRVGSTRTPTPHPHSPPPQTSINTLQPGNASTYCARSVQFTLSFAPDN